MADHAHMLAQRWNDILTPAVPPEINGSLLFAAIVLLLLVILVVIFLWQLRPRQSARRALRRYRRQLRSQAADTRAIAYHTYRAVLDGLSVDFVSLHSAASERGTWASFYRRLQACVFAAKPPGREEVRELIHDGLYWLRHDPTH